VICVPYCFTVADQIIKVLDPSIHQRVGATKNPAATIKTIMRDDFDQRWVACQRPFVTTGGELTLEMLDLSFNEKARFYEAPLHVKALNGVFLVDDFGRQLVSPEALLNRWIVPLASRVDYLKLHTGASFSLPFDELVIFSTNLAPSQLMDPAFLRRIPYKIKVGAPTVAEYHQIFHLIGKAKKIEIPDQMIDYIIEQLTVKNDFPIGSYQPGFIIGQVLAASKYEGETPEFTLEKVDMAISNLYTEDSPGFGMVRSQAKPAPAPTRPPAL